MTKKSPETILREAMVVARDEFKRITDCDTATSVKAEVFYKVVDALHVVPATPPIPHASELERKIVGKVVECLLDAGYLISVYDGEETTVRNATEGAAIWHALASTDSDTLNVRHPDRSRSFVFLVWGNGVDVISDHGISLKAVLKPAFDLAEALDDRGQS